MQLPAGRSQLAVKNDSQEGYCDLLDVCRISSSALCTLLAASFLHGFYFLKPPNVSLFAGKTSCKKR
jgi:hypothetical protein